ncbi:hypothetical protein C8J56DRAFT_965375 [Mycena floridula]|nr:hypothetical protein C8J56DRAFT_965375 [Mycena floridula]
MSSKIPSSIFQLQRRCLSSSPYGRTHVWKRRLPTLPNPVVPRFPQTVVRSDGSSYTHWSTSPRSVIRQTRDITNNPVWNTRMWADSTGEEDELSSAGRLGRFRRRFEGTEGMDWQASEVAGSSLEGELVEASAYEKKKGGKKRK